MSELNYFISNNTFKQWVQNVCRQGSESRLCQTKRRNPLNLSHSVLNPLMCKA